MPELPEVETIVRDLDKILRNKKISNIQALDKKVFQLSKKSAKTVTGRLIKEVKRRAKMIIIKLSNDNFLVIHLKMTGQLVFQSKTSLIAGGHPISHIGKTLPNKFTRVIFIFSDGSKLYFNDVRRFGWLKSVDEKTLSRLSDDLGIEPLSPAFSLENFEEILAHKKSTTIKQALMDQKYLSGLGNIYTDEALFVARIKPMRLVKSLKPDEIEKLWRAIPKILKYAIKHRGTSFNDYVDAQGEVGNFIRYLKVYGREGEPCQECGGVIKKIKLGGRGTHWCDACQK